MKTYYQHAWFCEYSHVRLECARDADSRHLPSREKNFCLMQRWWQFQTCSQHRIAPHLGRYLDMRHCRRQSEAPRGNQRPCLCLWHDRSHWMRPNDQFHLLSPLSEVISSAWHGRLLVWDWWFPDRHIRTQSCWYSSLRNGELQHKGYKNECLIAQGASAVKLTWGERWPGQWRRMRSDKPTRTFSCVF